MRNNIKAKEEHHNVWFSLVQEGQLKDARK